MLMSKTGVKGVRNRGGRDALRLSALARIRHGGGCGAVRRRRIGWVDRAEHLRMWSYRPLLRALIATFRRST